MRILQVIDSGGLYGAEHMLIALMNALKAQGVESALASIGTPNCREKAIEVECRRQGIQVERQTFLAGPDRRGANTLVRRAHQNGFELIHTHGYKANALIAGMRRGRRRLPAIATLHGWTASRILSRIFFYEMAERMLLHRADRVVAVSHAMVHRWRLAKRYGSRLSVIHNGIDASEPTDGQDDDLPRSISEFIAGRLAVLAAGRLSWEKGFDVLLDAIAILRSSGLNICVVLAGEGGLRTALENQVRRLNLQDSIYLSGYVEGVGHLVSSFDVVAIPSRSEGLPIVLLEALMKGVPVAATSVGEIPTVLAKCGADAAVAPNDARGFADSLKRILVSRSSDSRDSSVASKAKLWYSADAMAAGYRQIYAELLHDSLAQQPQRTDP